jgi:hypothetical protein
MTTISVLCPTSDEREYRAIADGREATGDTRGRAIDALVEQTGHPSGALPVVTPPSPGARRWRERLRVFPRAAVRVVRVFVWHGSARATRFAGITPAPRPPNR